MNNNGWRAGGALARTAVAFVLLLAAPADARPVDRWSAYIEAASHRFGVPEDWIRRVMRAESGGRTTLNGQPITSHAGAMGLMQLMPGTWTEMRRAHGLGPDPHDPRDNILAGTAYLRAMYHRFGYPGLFAAYHAGPARYADHMRTGRRLPAETIAYLAVTAGAAHSAEKAPQTSAASPQPAPQPFAASPLFAILRARESPAAPAGQPEPRASDALFVQLGGSPR